jgi:hypothetical protein
VANGFRFAGTFAIPKLKQQKFQLVVSTHPKIFKKNAMNNWCFFVFNPSTDVFPTDGLNHHQSG